MKHDALLGGLVIPAHPLALTAARQLDERHQRALTRYYLDAGAGGLAVGVHTTQFAIREPRHGLYRPVLELAAETITAWEARQRRQRIVRIAGIVGRTPQAVAEAQTAKDFGYEVGLLSLGAFPNATDDELLAHARQIAAVLPLMGFYLQPAVGGRILSYSFWRRLAEIPEVVAIKIAPFNRYHTLDVVRGVAESDRYREIALYTGNDDQIVLDLATVHQIRSAAFRGVRSLRMIGGLLGHWAFWTHNAKRLLDRIHRRDTNEPLPRSLLTLATQTTEVNAAVFDAANGFRGCIPGIHEILRRQGLVRGRWCLDPNEDLSPGQLEEIDRICRLYPRLADDAFVREHLDEWMK